MKIHDFDQRFYEYARTWVALHPGLSEQQIEDSYNEMMRSWLGAPAKWLDGEKPGEYFRRYSEPGELIKLLEAYDKRDIGLPEPLYSRVVELGEVCVPALTRVAGDADRSESLRATAIALLRDIGGDAARPLLIDLVCASAEPDELSEMAAEILSAGDPGVVEALLGRYEGASEYGQLLILDICVNFPGDGRVFDLLMDKLRNDPDQRAIYAGCLGKLGDPRAIEALKACLGLEDLSYFDYIELRNAVESLGGDPGEERTFYGDPDYEALRGL